VRRLFIVAYDISDPKRLRRVFRTLKGFGDHLQLSVFRCDISESQRLRLVAMLSSIIDAAHDQVIFVDLGPSQGQRHYLEALGRPTVQDTRRGPKVF
jgi:CRISPR-associated protein Cas2